MSENRISIDTGLSRDIASSKPHPPRAAQRANRLFGLVFAAVSPLIACTILGKLIATADFGDTSAIIWPLFAAALTLDGSKGMQAIGSIWSVAANLSGLISNRFRTPIWFNTSFGGASFGRVFLNR